MTEPTPTSYEPEIPSQPMRSLSDECERILAFLAAYPHASVEEIAATCSRSNASCRNTLDVLLLRGYVKRSTKRFVGWLAVPWMFDPNGLGHWPEERGPLTDMALLRQLEADAAWKEGR